MAERDAGEQARIAFAHGLHLTAQRDRDRLGGVRPVRRQHLVDVVRRGIQVAPLHIGMHVEHRADIQLRGDHRNGLAAECRQVHQKLALSVCRRSMVTGMVFRSCDDVDAIGRHLHHQGVAHAVARIDPEIRRRLRARIGRDQHVVRRLLLGHADLRGQRAVHIHGQCRRIRNLKHMRVDDARHLRQIARDLRREREGCVLIRPGDPHIDGRGLAEIQHLIDDIGGLKEELQLGEMRRQRPAQLGDELRRRLMLFLQRNQYLAIHRAHGGRIAQGDIDAAVRQADVVEHDVDLIAADRVGGSPPRPRQNIAASSPGACPAARARADASGRHPPAERNRGPAAGTDTREPTIKMMNARDGRDRLRQRPRQRVSVFLPERLESAFEAGLEAHQNILRRACCPPAGAALQSRKACTDPRMRMLNSTGTMVKDSARLASSAPMTESESGENRYFAVPCSRNTGTNTMQMHKRRQKCGNRHLAGARRRSTDAAVRSWPRAARCSRSPPCRCRPECRSPAQSRRASWYSRFARSNR